MTQTELKLVECSGSPREMGRQYGEQAKEEIRCNLARFAPAQPESMLHLMRRNLEKYAPEVLEELNGIAEGSGSDPDAVLAYNHWELAGDDAERCTVMVLHTENEGILTAKNNDSPDGEDGRFVIRRGKSLHGIPFIQVTYAGSLSGLDMVNAEGLCNMHGSVGSRFARPRSSPDIRLRLYQLMQTCRSAEELVEGLRQIPLTGKGFSIGVSDRSGNSLFLDAAVPLIAERARNRKFAFSTNLYEAPGFENADMRNPAKRNVCLFRNGYLQWVSRTSPPEDLDGLEKLLSSHEPWAPCRHGGPHGSVTDWSAVAAPHLGKLLVSPGPPCRAPYREYTLP